MIRRHAVWHPDDRDKPASDRRIVVHHAHRGSCTASCEDPFMRSDEGDRLASIRGWMRAREDGDPSSTGEYAVES